MHGQDFQITELDRFLNYKFRSIDRKYSDFQGDSLSTHASKSTMAHRLLKIEVAGLISLLKGLQE